MYSKADKRLTAQVMFGVPGSYLKGKLQGLNHVSFTSFIAHHQENIGEYLSNNSYFPHKTPTQESAKTLCPVKNKKSQFNFLTSTLK
jgi:alpha-galactosidase/6-phospho-beta-glucosidase family protein